MKLDKLSVEDNTRITDFINYCLLYGVQIEYSQETEKYLVCFSEHNKINSTLSEYEIGVLKKLLNYRRHNPEIINNLDDIIAKANNTKYKLFLTNVELDDNSYSGVKFKAELFNNDNFKLEEFTRLHTDYYAVYSIIATYALRNWRKLNDKSK